MSKILITGIAGFIGSHLQDRLLELGHEVIGIDDLSSGSLDNLNFKTDFWAADIRGFNQDVGKIDYIFHLAAIARVPYSVKFPLLTHDVNVNGTLNMLDYARRCFVKKFIFASSSSVYGDQELPFSENAECRPKSPYALQKRIGELLMKLYDDLYGVPTVSLRFFNVYGPRCNPDSEYSLVIGKFLKQKKEGRPLTIYGDGEQSRDFTYISDVVDGLIAAMEKPVRNEVINLCNGNSTTINKIAELIGGEKEYLAPRLGDVLHTKGDPEKAKKLLNWEGKITIEQGLEMTRNYFEGKHILEKEFIGDKI